MIYSVQGFGLKTRQVELDELISNPSIIVGSKVYSPTKLSCEMGDIRPKKDESVFLFKHYDLCLTACAEDLFNKVSRQLYYKIKIIDYGSQDAMNQKASELNDSAISRLFVTVLSGPLILVALPILLSRTKSK